MGQPAGEENYNLPVDEANFERHYAAALTFYGWDADRTELRPFGFTSSKVGTSFLAPRVATESKLRGPSSLT